MKPKVLVIEDTATIREEIVTILEFEDFDVRGAEDGREGLGLARDFRPDLILCDVMMPVMDGEETLRTLRADPVLATTPFLCLTALADRGDMRRMMLAGADDYVTKPFSVHDMVQAVHAGLAKGARAKQDSARKVKDLRERLATSLSHELRTPLNGILGPADLLADIGTELGDKDVAEFSQVIHQSAERLRRTLDNFLLYADLELLRQDEEDHVPPSQEDAVSLSPVLQGIAARAARESGRSTDLSIQDIEVSVSLPEEQLRKILEEVLDNAFTYSNTGSLVEVVAEATDGVVRISVADHGRGMSPEELGSLGPFIRFQSAGEPSDGMGLGLVVARALIEFSGGELRIDSAPGRGTTVQVSLPCASKASPAPGILPGSGLVGPT